MVRNLVLICLIFGFIYFKMFWGVFQKEDLQIRKSHGLRNKVLFTAEDGVAFTGAHLYNLSVAIDKQMSELEKGAFKQFQVKDNFLEQQRLPEKNRCRQPTRLKQKGFGKLENPQVRDYNIKFQNQESGNGHHANDYYIDLRENGVQHTGWYGGNFWEAIHEQSLASQTLNKLLSGAHSVLNMLIASTWLDRSMLSKEISVTYQTSLQLLRSETSFSRVAFSEERVENMLRYYLASVKRLYDEKEQVKQMLKKQDIIPGLKGGVTEAFNSVLLEIESFLPSISSINLDKILALDYSDSSQLQTAQAIQAIEHEIMCTVHSCPVCYLNGRLLYEQISHLIEQPNHDSMISSLVLAWYPHQAVQLYIKHLEQEESSNHSKTLVKYVYLGGIVLSMVASLWIVDYYAKRQMKADQERVAEEKNEHRRLKEEVEQQYRKEKEEAALTKKPTDSEVKVGEAQETPGDEEEEESEEENIDGKVKTQ